MRTASVPLVHGSSSHYGDMFGLMHLVHEVMADPEYRATCGIGFLRSEFHVEPQLVTCLWCLAQRSYTL